MSKNYSGVTLQQLEVFLAAAKYENFSHASRELHMTTPAVSRNIASLEEQLGIILFVRHRQRVRLTNAGRYLAKGLLPISNQFTKLIDNTMDQQKCQYEKLQIAEVSIGTNYYYLLPVIELLEKSYPQLEVAVQSVALSDAVEGLLSGVFDIAFLVGTEVLSETGIISKPYIDGKSCLVISEKHPLFAKEDLTLEDLKADKIISCKGGLFESYHNMAETFYRENGFSLEKVRYMDNAASVDMELHRGRCIALLNDIYANPSRKDLRAVPLPKEWEMDFGIRAAYLPDNTNPFLRRFLACIDAIRKSK